MPSRSGIGLLLGREKRERGLHVGDPAVGREPGRRPLAVAPALVVEGQHDIAGAVQDARDVRQVQVADAGIAVAQHDPGAPFAGTQIIGQKQIAREFDALAVEIDRSFHPRLRNRTPRDGVILAQSRRRGVAFLRDDELGLRDQRGALAVGGVDRGLHDDRAAADMQRHRLGPEAARAARRGRNWSSIRSSSWWRPAAG